MATLSRDEFINRIQDRVGTDKSEEAIRVTFALTLKKNLRGPFNGGGHQHYPPLQRIIPEVSLKTPCKTDSWADKMAIVMLGENI